MARAARKSVKDRRAKPVRRARRVTMAAEKSRAREKRAMSKDSRRPGAPASAKPRAKTARSGKPEAAPAKDRDRRKKPRPSAAPRRVRKTTPRTKAAEEMALEPQVPSGLTDEEQIESAKYQPRRSARPRVFEEERFLFPQSYGVNRLRLLVKDPEWLFAYWDVDPSSLEALRSELGNRVSALSQLTLRVFEDRRGGASTFLLPQGSRTWYVPARTAGRAYRAEVGVILPSGEFRPLARSNSVTTPRVGRSGQKATRRVRYDRARSVFAGGAGLAPGEEAAEREWDAPLEDGALPEEDEQRPSARSRGGRTAKRGGASDVYRR